MWYVYWYFPLCIYCYRKNTILIISYSLFISLTWQRYASVTLTVSSVGEEMAHFTWFVSFINSDGRLTEAGIEVFSTAGYRDTFWASMNSAALVLGRHFPPGRESCRIIAPKGKLLTLSNTFLCQLLHFFLKAIFETVLCRFILFLASFFCECELWAIVSVGRNHSVGRRRENRNVGGPSQCFPQNRRVGGWGAGRG